MTLKEIGEKLHELNKVAILLSWPAYGDLSIEERKKIRDQIETMRADIQQAFDNAGAALIVEEEAEWGNEYIIVSKRQQQ